MATETELYQQILTNLGVDCNSLPDLTLTTLLTAIAKNCGGGGGSAGGGAFIVSMTGENSLDKTYDEIKAAYESGSVVMLEQGGILIPLALAPSNGSAARFSVTVLSGSDIVAMTATVTPDNAVTMSMGTVAATMMGGDN